MATVTSAPRLLRWGLAGRQPSGCKSQEEGTRTASRSPRAVTDPCAGGSLVHSQPSSHVCRPGSPSQERGRLRPALPRGALCSAPVPRSGGASTGMTRISCRLWVKVGLLLLSSEQGHGAFASFTEFLGAKPRRNHEHDSWSVKAPQSEGAADVVLGDLAASRRPAVCWGARSALLPRNGCSVRGWKCQVPL